MSLQIWWKAWDKLVRKLVALALSFVSVVWFIPSPKDLLWWQVALLVSTTFFVVLLVVFELIDHRGRRVYSKTDTKGITKYMHNWIEHGSRVAIWTRDMTWAQNPETRSLLTKKAKRGELILCLPKINKLASHLKSAGAEVCAYGNSDLGSPASRFTIAFFGRDGSSVAVGRAEGDAHVIDEFSSSDHPAFHVAEDLITFAQRHSREKDSE